LQVKIDEREFVMDEDFAWFLEQFDQPTGSVRVRPEAIERFRGKLPDRLLDYWNEFGFASFRMGSSP
jgi:hypothetical protein